MLDRPISASEPSDAPAIRAARLSTPYFAFSAPRQLRMKLSLYSRIRQNIKCRESKENIKKYPGPSSRKIFQLGSQDGLNSPNFDLALAQR
jgi:hypothetical protein